MYVVASAPPAALSDPSLVDGTPAPSADNAAGKLHSLLHTARYLHARGVTSS